VKRRLPPLTAIRAFEAAGRHLSFSRAADELFVTQSAVSRQIHSLEEHLGVPVFRRYNRRLELTQAGSNYLDVLKECFDRMEDATAHILQAPSPERLLVSVPPTLGIRWLGPRLMSFAQANPQIDVQMIMSTDPIDFTRDQVDVGIRIGQPGGRGERGTTSMASGGAEIQADRLFPDTLVPVCSPRLRDEGPPLRTPKDLARHVLLHTTTRRNAWNEWQEAFGVGELKPKDALWFGHFFMTHQAACEGRGIAMLPLIFVMDELQQGHLVTVLQRPVVSVLSYYLLYREQQGPVQKLERFRSWISREVEGAVADIGRFTAAQAA
jgi:LysR family glycine cleavage system transcriptional activator